MSDLTDSDIEFEVLLEEKTNQILALGFEFAELLQIDRVRFGESAPLNPTEKRRDDIVDELASLVESPDEPGLNCVIGLKDLLYEEIAKKPDNLGQRLKKIVMRWFCEDVPDITDLVKRTK